MLRKKFQKESYIKKNSMLIEVGVLFQLLFCFSVFAKDLSQLERPYATEIPWESIWKSTKLQIEISSTDPSESTKEEIPSLPTVKNNVLCLRFRVRLNSTSGWNYLLSMKWNDHPINNETKGGNSRLINRHSFLETTHPVEQRIPIYNPLCFITFFGLDFDRLDPQILSDREEGYWYLFDISDLVKSGEPAEIEFVDTALKSYFKDNPSISMIVDSVEIGAVDEAVIDVLRKQNVLEQRQSIADTSLKGGKVLPKATKIPWKSVWKASQLPIEIPILDKPSSTKMSIPILPTIKDKVFCLRFEARLHSSSGWNYFLGIKLNGYPLSEMKNSTPRLINRHMSVETSHPVEKKMSAYMNYGSAANIPCFITFFGLNFNMLDPQILSDREEGYWYLFDISDLVKSGEPAEIEFVNTALKSYFKDNPSISMIVDSVEIGVVDRSVINTFSKIKLEQRETLSGPSINVGKAVTTIVPDGGLQIRLLEEMFFVETRLKVLGRENWLRCSSSSFNKDVVWKPICTKEKSVLNLSANTDHYVFHRKVMVDNNKFNIEDTITNRTNDTLGIILHHQIITPNMADISFLGGVNRRLILPFRSPENPTIFISQNRSGLGLVVEDDALRLQFEAEIEENVGRCGTRHFGLGPGKSYTFRWALYPGGTDYFDFVNAVRRDWNVNFTILGPFDFFPIIHYQKPEDVDKLKELLSRQPIKIFCLSSPWFGYGSSLGLIREKYKEMAQKTIKIIKSVQPDSICIAATECNLTPVPLSFFGDTLPEDFKWGYTTGGSLGKSLLPEASSLVDQSPYNDSVLRDINGLVRVDTFYVDQYTSPKSLNLMVYPTLNNYRYAQMKDNFRFLLDEVGVDGIYIDQFSMAFQIVDHFTYEKWDGQTVDINEETGEITQKYSDLCYISATARRQLCEFILSKGKIVVANSSPAIQLMQSLPIFRFMETGGYDPMSRDIPDASMCAMGQLASPIALSYMWNAGGKTSQDGKFLMRTLIAHLRYGMLYYCYSANRSIIPVGSGDYGPLRHMFPFTPIELHKGWILGKERLITCVSGTFLWKNNTKPTIHLFDENGVEIPIMATITSVDKVFSVSLKLKDWHQVAVIE